MYRGHEVNSWKYINERAIEKGFKTRREYITYLENKRKRRPEYRAMKFLVESRLESLDKSRRWLARKLNISPATVDSYAYAKALPGKRNLKKLFSFLSVTYASLSELVEDYAHLREASKHGLVKIRGLNGIK